MIKRSDGIEGRHGCMRVNLNGNAEEADELLIYERWIGQHVDSMAADHGLFRFGVLRRFLLPHQSLVPRLRQRSDEVVYPTRLQPSMAMATACKNVKRLVMHPAG